MSDDLHNEIARLYRENDALRAAVRRVEALPADLAGDVEHSRVHGDGPAEYREGWQHGVQFAADQVRAALGEPPAETCAANGCRNRATGMRKSYVPGWPDEPDCGLHGTADGSNPADTSEVDR